MFKIKIALMSGAYINAGDFLIVKRCKEILRKVLPNCTIIEFLRKDPLTTVTLAQINSCDIIVLAGGPLYQRNVYPNIIPLTDNINNITPPFFCMACGQSLVDSEPHNIYHFHFTPQAQILLDRIASDGFPFGCRDIYTAQLLQNLGYNTMLTGCAAWYDCLSDNITSTTFINKPIEHICISDCAGLRNANGLNIYPTYSIARTENIILTLKHNYPHAKLQFVFHRLMKPTHKPLLDFLKANSIPSINIAGSSDGFTIYDNCDLHVGFRVHAHIYNLSKRNRSILIAEDARGCGVNDTLGLTTLKCFDSRDFIFDQPNFESIAKRLGRNNQYLTNQLNYLINSLEQTNWVQYNWTFHRMVFYYHQMIDHLSLLKNIHNKTV